MSFMQPEIYRGDAWLVETYNGTEVIPADLVHLEPFHGDHDSTEYSEWLNDAIHTLRDYCEAAIIEVPDAPESGWLARLQAPGYMDCTPWMFGESESDVTWQLKRCYGDDDGIEGDTLEQGE